MNTPSQAGSKLLAALAAERPLQVVGVINAYCALLAEHAGFKALYLSGAGVANASYGLPDLGITTIDNVLEDIRRITGVTNLPLLVDADTGFGDPAQTVERFIAAGAAGLHIEDQIEQKRCGHRPNKQLVSVDDMCARIEAADLGRQGNDFVIMARTDAVASEGMDAALQRIERYLHAGADMIFAEAITRLEDYQHITAHIDAPVLANITEFGQTPLFTRQQLAEADVALALYPLTAFRAMSAAAEQVYTTVRDQGTQAGLIDQMQTREQLYQHLDYYRFEREYDQRQEQDDD